MIVPTNFSSPTLLKLAKQLSKIYYAKIKQVLNYYHIEYKHTKIPSMQQYEKSEATIEMNKG